MLLLGRVAQSDSTLTSQKAPSHVEINTRRLRTQLSEVLALALQVYVRLDAVLLPVAVVDARQQLLVHPVVVPRVDEAQRRRPTAMVVVHLVRLAEEQVGERYLWYL